MKKIRQHHLNEIENLLNFNCTQQMGKHHKSNEKLSMLRNETLEDEKPIVNLKSFHRTKLANRIRLLPKLQLVRRTGSNFISAFATETPVY
jgi:hypothetical protein